MVSALLPPLGWALGTGWVGEGVGPPSIAPSPVDPLQWAEAISAHITPPSQTHECPCWHTPSRSTQLGAKRGVFFPGSAVGHRGSGFRGHS